MRAALLPAGPDPLLTAYWLRNYREVWADEVDELRILVCGQADPEILAYLERIAAESPHTILTHTPWRTHHGTAIGRLVADTQAEYVMLCEDDAFVRQKGVVAERFRRVESGETDIVGCPRGNTNPDVVEAAVAKWGPWEHVESGEVGHSLWPCFLFIRRADLLRTDGHYDSRTWAPGETIEGLGFLVPEGSGLRSGDTFVSASYQLRALGLRIQLESEFRIDAALMHTWGHVPWFHVGSLSSGIGSHWGPGGLTGDAYRDRCEIIAAPNEIRDWYKRTSFWLRTWAKWHRDPALLGYHAVYGEALTQFIADIRADKDTFDWWYGSFDHLVTWPE